MIYTVIGTDNKIREKAFVELKKLGTPADVIYSENIDRLRPHIDAIDIFGEKIIISLVQVFDNTSSKEKAVELLPLMKDSKNIFIIDEPFIDSNRAKTLIKYTKEFFDARVEKEKGVDVFKLIDFISKRDKRSAWVYFMKIKEDISGEEVVGALWWKWQMIWAGVISGKKGVFSKEECEDLGERIVKSSIIAHRGEGNLKVEIEKIILSI